MKMTPLRKLGIVVAVQLAVLFSVIAFKQYTVWTGETVLLKVQPVDPRDPFRGDYTTVRYEISNLSSELVYRDGGGIDGSAFIELREGDDGYWRAVAVHDNRERDFDDSVIVKGKPDYSRFNRDTISFVYGIEELFIPEGSGNQLPFGPDHTIAVAIKVDRFGNAIPRYFVVDGERLELQRR
ncbi:MAG TPA: GDYXXLXY domain-containing protein [Dehalococcoidia bacterium]